MEKTQKISVEQCCIYYQIETTFVQQLDEYGLIELKRSGKKQFINYEHLPDLEKFIRMHYDMAINLEGIEAITHLLNRMQHLQQEIKRLENELGK